MNTTQFDGLYTNEDSLKDGYPQFEQAVNNRFDSIINGGNNKLFTTNATNIYETYLSNLPVNAQQHYQCRACQSFFNKYGGLVTIDENGAVQSVLWDETAVPTFFAKAVKAVKRLVLNSKVVGVFLSDVKTLGQPKTGEWTHIHAKLPTSMVYRDRVLTAGQKMAEKVQDFQMLTNALLGYSLETVEQALALINSETMYRSDRVSGIAQWFKEVIVKRDSLMTAEQKRNFLWLAVATAPTGFTHIKSSMIGTLLDDIQEGLSASLVSARFAEKMNPANFMRSQSAPSTNAIYEAEKLVAKLGIETALQRRYATLEEIPNCLWKPKANATVNRLMGEQSRGGVFGHLTPKSNATTGVMSLPTSVMTWEKFQRTVMPTSDKIEVLVDNPNRLMAMVTAVDENAENILQWDNTFSWYYHGGIDAEMKRRVEEAGGRYEDNEIRCSLLWEGLTDLDLHCITPTGEHINYSHKRGRCGGYLDLDMNGLDKSSSTPVENMRWSTAPQGRYRFYVNNFSERVNGYKGTPFKVELEINGQIYNYEGEALPEKRDVTVFEFDYIRGQQPVIRSNSQGSSNNAWSVDTGKFVKVNGITASPNLWGKAPVISAGVHVFFLLDGAQDLSEGKGRGFFNETLKSDLRQIRKTLELFTANTPIEDADEATACGVGYSKDNEWNLTVKVTTGNSSRIIKIDRWD
ncbi:hypothetical protein CN984_12050 [Bacillus cereus]|uniref:Uncharacterized protein n=1 Tax=Bacillus cereus TaxID=1396 RepID=A0A2A7FNK7_BACCE|nr:hypothetical protein [Bacillus cereus]PEA25847.1 hypothetical protein CON44_18045 [Bacillus cereus]PGO29172.1 hypothetical protein CN984_12050 [Bacillus cereus]